MNEWWWVNEMDFSTNETCSSGSFQKLKGCLTVNKSRHYCHLPGANCANAARRS